ncbi:hypothetical protein niasHS_002005 [Heterodera schachtii]|uniref:SWIM-type domain-containing protein n=1 Tax=Heterodera schachtii TaxID=97005 RepID=A0ABD2K6D1_HETSC
MVFVNCSLFSSIFAVLLLLCVISVLLEHGHCGFYTNLWGCVPAAEDTEAKCEKESHENINEFRANLSAPAATDWKCTCHFGAKGKDMDNEQFVAASCRHGVAMLPLIVIGLVIDILPLFRDTILGRLNP